MSLAIIHIFKSYHVVMRKTLDLFEVEGRKMTGKYYLKAKNNLWR